MPELNPAVLIALLLTLYMLWWFGNHQSNCVQCGGRGKHRDGCPFKRPEDG